MSYKSKYFKICRHSLSSLPEHTSFQTECSLVLSIRANDLNDAIHITKQNTEFEYTTKVRVAVQPIKSKEVSTGFVCPKKGKLFRLFQWL